MCGIGHNTATSAQLSWDWAELGKTFFQILNFKCTGLMFCMLNFMRSKNDNLEPKPYDHFFSFLLLHVAKDGRCRGQEGPYMMINIFDFVV